MRPSLCVWSAAAGGEGCAVAPFAAGLEFLHVASLTHDDIVDRAPERRGRASAVGGFNLSAALLSGDCLFATGMAAMVRSGGGGPAEHLVSALQVAADAIREMARATTQETLVRKDPACDLSVVLEIHRGKTAALLRAACESGALLAGAPGEQVAALREYGEELGMAFQIRDEILPYTTPAAPRSDIHNRQPTVPVLLAYGAATETERAEMRHLFVDDAEAPGVYEFLTTLFASTGAVERSLQMARGHALRARGQLEQIPASPYRPGPAGKAHLLRRRPRPLVARTRPWRSSLPDTG